MIRDWQNFRLDEPLWLLALLILPLVIWLRGRHSVAAIILPFSGAWRRHTLASGRKLPVFLAFMATFIAIAALSRPQYITTERTSKSKGYDIMLAIDLSGSMEAEDYFINGKRSNRLAATKPVLSAFINRRENDRIGLIAFAGRAYTVAPLSFNHEWLARQTERLRVGLVEDGTAIGDALAVATSRLLEGAKERAGEREGAFIVLLTDGMNTAGLMEPMEGAKLAMDSGIPVYTIAAGKDERARLPRRNSKGERIGSTVAYLPIDLDTLKRIAEETDGQFYRAESSDTISKAFESIDESAKIEFETSMYSIVTELFPYPLYLAAGLGALSIFLSILTRKEAFA